MDVNTIKLIGIVGAEKLLGVFIFYIVWKILKCVLPRMFPYMQKLIMTRPTIDTLQIFGKCILGVILLFTSYCLLVFSIILLMNSFQQPFYLKLKMIENVARGVTQLIIRFFVIYIAWRIGHGSN
jgi:hypothetical protein